jgi:rod shape-determining protein MreC
MPRKRLLLFVFIIASLGLMTYQSNREHLLPFKFLNNTLNRLHAVKKSVTDSVTSPFERMALRETENRRLKAELAGLLREQQKYRELILENRRLKDLFSLKDREQKYVVASRVIARGVSPWSNTCVIDKGFLDGIAKDMVAVTHRGLVGKISEVSDSHSLLLLLTDINFSAAARLQESRTEGIISGTGFRICQLKYIPHEEKVGKGNIVITSGLDSLFPPGIPIGYVSRVNRAGTGIFQDIEVIPFEDNGKIEEIVIIKK